MTDPRLGVDDLAARCRAIELLVLDVDGVMTDGLIVVDDRGVESKHFHVRDGSAITLWRLAGHRVAILSGRRAEVVDRRAAELGIAPVIQGSKDKLDALCELSGGLGVGLDRVCYMGDDLPDLPALAVAGLAACPSDALPEVRAACQLISEHGGGRGAVREVIEAILRSQGGWNELVGPLIAAASRGDPPPQG